MVLVATELEHVEEHLLGRGTRINHLVDDLVLAVLGMVLVGREHVHLEAHHGTEDVVGGWELTIGERDEPFLNEQRYRPDLDELDNPQRRGRVGHLPHPLVALGLVHPEASHLPHDEGGHGGVGAGRSLHQLEMLELVGLELLEKLVAVLDAIGNGLGGGVQDPLLLVHPLL